MSTRNDDHSLCSYLDLFKSLPTGGLSGHPGPALAIAALDDLFVGPTLRVVEAPERPSVTLISARGATGKSVLAHRLSATAHAPLWDLALDSGVSADALSGRLIHYLGANGPARFASSTDAFLVIDALDEARMRVSAQSWSEFLDSLVAVANNGHRFVLLGRERILEEVWVHFDDAGRSCAWYEISHFNSEQRAEYVDRRYEAAGQQTTPTYKHARDAVLRALAGTVDSSLAESFVGYAPVLDAVVTLLVRDNPIRVLNAFEQDVAAEDRVDVLRTVLERLLTREQTKVTPTVTEMGLDPSIAYQADEQIAWLAAELMGGSPPILNWCPHVKRGEYAEKIGSFLRDHPFRSEARWASPVFSSYVASQVFGDVRVRDALNEVGRSTGLLFDFVLNQEVAAEIDEWQFAALHHSMLAGEWQDVTAEVAIAPDRETDVLEEIAGQLHLAEGTRTRGTDFVLTLDTPGELHLYGSAAFLSADFPGSVIVHDHNGSTTLGPDAYVACAHLEVRGESVEVARRPPQPGASERPVDVSIVLEVTGAFQISGRMVGAPPPDLLEIRVPQDTVLRHPWVSYRQGLVPSATTPDERARRFLNMLMNLLRRHGHGGSMAVFDKKLQGRQSIKHGELKAVLAALQDMGIIEYTGGLIFLDRGWEQHWFSGKARAGLPSLDDKVEAWDPALKRISAVLAA